MAVLISHFSWTVSIPCRSTSLSIISSCTKVKLCKISIDKAEGRACSKETPFISAMINAKIGLKRLPLPDKTWLIGYLSESGPVVYIFFNF